MPSVTNPTAAAGVTGTASAQETTPRQTANLATDPLAQKEAFLKLLVAQIRNQNPLQPADGIEFLSQLAQFSQLEQTLNIRSELEMIRKSLTQRTDAAPAAPGAASGTGA